LPDATLADVRTEVVPFGHGGRSLGGGIEQAMDSRSDEFDDPEGWGQR
jgi:hypothetical protein